VLQCTASILYDIHIIRGVVGNHVCSSIYIGMYTEHFDIDCLTRSRSFSNVVMISNVLMFQCGAIVCVHNNCCVCGNIGVAARTDRASMHHHTRYML
jgi:hypothetical protein